MLHIGTLKLILLILIGILNLFSLALFYSDKKRAQSRQRRLSEKTLLLSAFLLGGIGALFGMFNFRHKTQHFKFKILIPISAIVTFVGIYLLLAL